MNLGKMVKSVVTGGAGFIGSHLVDLLLYSGHEVCVIDNLATGSLENLDGTLDRITFVKSDLSMEDHKWEQQILGSDYIFHLASLADIVPSINDPHSYWKANVISTLNILKVLEDSPPRKLVYAASSSCYGIASEYPTPETARIQPEYPYALTKRIGEELVEHWGKIYNIPYISTRFFNVYGTRSRTSGTYGAVMGIFLAQKLAGKPLTIVGDGNQTRDFTYVSDICQGLLLAAESEINAGIYNLGSGKRTSINQLAALIGGEVVYIPKRPGEPDITHADITKANTDLGYQPKISLEKGMEYVLREIDYWRDAPVWTPDTIKAATTEWFAKLS